MNANPQKTKLGTPSMLDLALLFDSGRYKEELAENVKQFAE